LDGWIGAYEEREEELMDDIDEARAAAEPLAEERG
jgi:hypothetical protein